MTKIIWDHRTGKRYTEEEWLEVQRDRMRSRSKNIDFPMIMRDIEPYENVIDGKTISSRSEHREFLKRHGVEEAGDLPLESFLDKPDPTEDVEKDVIQAYQDYEQGKRPEPVQEFFPEELDGPETALEPNWEALNGRGSQDRE